MKILEKVVVTGGAGFIGSHLAAALSSGGAEVHVIDNLSGGGSPPVGVVAHTHDIRDVAQVAQVCDGAAYVFHCAAQPSVPYSIEHPIETHETNVVGTLAVFEAARRAGVARVIFSSSSAVYGEGSPRPLSEEDAPAPLSPYALHKLIGEQYGALYGVRGDLFVVSLRYFNVYGPGMRTDGAYASVIGQFAARRRAGAPLVVFGDGEQTRDFVHVRDVVSANICAAQSSGAHPGDVYNIGSGNAYSINRIVALMGGEVEHAPARQEPRFSRADITKARSVLGWEPKVRFEDGIREFMQGYGIV